MFIIIIENIDIVLCTKIEKEQDSSHKLKLKTMSTYSEDTAKKKYRITDGFNCFKFVFKCSCVYA